MEMKNCVKITFIFFINNFFYLFLFHKQNVKKFNIEAFNLSWIPTETMSSMTKIKFNKNIVSPAGYPYKRINLKPKTLPKGLLENQSLLVKKYFAAKILEEKTTKSK